MKIKKKVQKINKNKNVENLTRQFKLEDVTKPIRQSEYLRM